MKKSIFNISQQIGDKILLYNTFTTSMVEMSKELYESVFVQDDFSISETSSLYSMGFLIDDSCDEVLAMENLRNEVVKNSSDKIANIIIAPTLASVGAIIILAILSLLFFTTSFRRFSIASTSSHESSIKKPIL